MTFLYCMPTFDTLFLQQYNRFCYPNYVLESIYFSTDHYMRIFCHCRTWGEWSGNPKKYTEMKFTNGLGCWNGPNRSTKVQLSYTILSAHAKCIYV